MDTKRQINNHRILWMDMLNIIAIIGVCMMHCNNAQNVYDGNMTFPFVWGAAVHSFFLWPVDVFFMLTGANLIGKSWLEEGKIEVYAKKRFRKTGVPFIFWSIFYWLLFSRTTNPYDIIDGIIHTKFNPNLWFFISLFAIYLSIPFIEIFVINVSKKVLEVFLVVAFVLLSVCPFLFELFNMDFITEAFPLGGNYLAMAILGYYLKTYPVDGKRYKKVCLLGVYAVILNFIGFLLLNYLQGSPNKIFMGYLNPCCICITIAVFSWFQHHRFTCIEEYAEKIAYISSCTLGVYVIHRAVQGAFQFSHLYILNNYIWVFISVYIVSLACVMVIK